MQITRSCRCNPQLPPTDRRVTHGLCWWSMVRICNLPQKPPENLSKGQPTPGPKDRRSDSQLPIPNHD
ncbi:hypothetical protein MTR67_022964 [Solanum verrucosum]|uniref:Uncharacterized protein n=1 Tax=Solanum verrucosum TaxID=315347 RepID=A0AAF0QSM3_SOLVR|nr:hypothetical protein MTR67_022964 [Solanum verrucosum]